MSDSLWLATAAVLNLAGMAGLALSTALAALSFYTLERWAMRYRDNLSQKAL